MNATIPILLVSTVAVALASPSAAQKPGRPVDCLESVADQATGGCLRASSTPTLGMLHPYPGHDNVFVPPSFVGGGESNAAVGTWSTIGGGYANTASDDGATIGGGGSNVASANSTTIGGGSVNTASGFAATIGGGSLNTAAGVWTTVGGGARNDASGGYATVAGGHDNDARGNHSFAAGRRAKANHAGAFVWGDGRNADKTSSAADEFSVYASGGVRLFTNGAATSGVLLAPGASTWTMVSDRDAKENVEPVDARAVLDEVARLPIATWNYEDQPDAIRHMGPMAQDFHAAFGLGLGEKTIDTIDPNGVALAAIQGLDQLVREKDTELERRLAEKDAEIEGLRAANEDLRRRVERLEALARGARPLEASR